MRHDAIRQVYPNAKMIDDSAGVFDFAGNRIDIDNNLILAKIKELQAQYEANEYQRQRAAEYPSWQEQLDMQYWDKINGTNNWQEAIQAVKTKHPKPEA